MIRTDRGSRLTFISAENATMTAVKMATTV
jgi:hypothetical protein